MDFTNEFLDFVVVTIAGQESGLYKVFGAGVKDKRIVLPMSLMEYVNHGYKSLILRNDPYWVTHFDKFNQFHGHSQICLLNVLFQLIQTFLELIDATQLYVLSYQTYMASITSQLECIKNALIKTFPKIFDHQCSGADITKCDPNIPLFYLKACKHPDCKYECLHP